MRPLQRGEGPPHGHKQSLACANSESMETRGCQTYMSGKTKTISIVISTEQASEARFQTQLKDTVVAVKKLLTVDRFYESPLRSEVPNGVVFGVGIPMLRPACVLGWAGLNQSSDQV